MSVWLERLVWTAAVALLVVNLPVMACMPLTADNALYDLQAKTAMAGGVLYQDVFEPNLPGAVWVHMGVRSLFGWSSVALRVFDLVVFFGIVGLLLNFMPGSRQLKGIAGALVIGCYFSMTEWCHCQRDTWMLLPALGALSLRAHQLRKSISESPASQSRPIRLRTAIVEGMLWGVAFWLKPFIAIPAIACLCASACVMKSQRSLLQCVASVIFGGAIVGAIGSAWLIAYGAWQPFWNVFLEWNPEYLAAGKERWTFERFQGMASRFYPWMLVHAVAIPIAISQLMKIRAHRKLTSGDVSVVLLAALYLGWLVQAFGFQHLLDYIHVPALLLGIFVVASYHWAELQWGLMPKAGLACFVMLAVCHSPMIQPRSVLSVRSCLIEGSTAEVRDAVKRNAHPNWQELDNVAAFLKSRGATNNEVTCYNGNTVHVHALLDVQPSMPYVYLETLIRLFPSKHNVIREAVENSPHRFIVTSLRESGMSDGDARELNTAQPARLPDSFPEEHRDEFPWTQPVVYRSGHYVVHEVTQPLGAFNTTTRPLRKRPENNHHSTVVADTK